MEIVVGGVYLVTNKGSEYGNVIQITEMTDSHWYKYETINGDIGLMSMFEEGSAFHGSLVKPHCSIR